MAHHTTNTHRRILASPDPSISSSSSSSSSSMDPTLTKHPIPSSSSSCPTPQNRDPTLPSQVDSFYSSRPNPDHKSTKTSLKPTKQEPPVRPNTHLRPKAMTLSADFDSSRYSSLIKPKNQQYSKSIEPEVGKGRRVKTAKEGEKVKKLSSKEELLEKKKVQQATVNDKHKRELCAVGKNNREVKDLLERLDIKGMSVSLGGVGGGGRRESFCGSQVELADFLANCGAKVVSVDMPSFMQIHAVDCARKTCDSLEKFTSKALALTLKKEFDRVYGPAWHCIVGTSFGSFVTHSVGGFLYFSIDQKLYILLFKTTVQRAD